MATWMILYLAKLAAFGIKVLNLGKASSFPGRLAMRLNSCLLYDLCSELNANSDFSFIVSGTNGKSTTTGMLKSICSKYLEATNRNPRLICNDIGANLNYGILSELIRSTNWRNQLKTFNYVLEVDEAAFETLARDLKPRIVTLTNIYRDQLDRFGEIDATQKLIARAIDNAARQRNNPLTLVLNSDDPKISELPRLLQAAANINCVYYKVISDESIENIEKNLTLLNKYPHFDADNNLTLLNKSQVLLQAKVLERDMDSSLVDLIGLDGRSLRLRIPIPGLYNIYNALAAASSALAYGISLDIIVEGIESYTSLFGRSETVQYKGSSYKVFLIKNPAGCTEVIKLLKSEPQANYLIAINDNYADGRDVSWLWDANFELLKPGSRVICSGSRAYDMALRLKYAGHQMEAVVIEPNLNKALDMLVDMDGKAFVLPTYTALLELNHMGFGI